MDAAALHSVQIDVVEILKVHDPDIADLIVVYTSDQCWHKGYALDPCLSTVRNRTQFCGKRVESADIFVGSALNPRIWWYGSGVMPLNWRYTVCSPAPISSLQYSTLFARRMPFVAI